MSVFYFGQLFGQRDNPKITFNFQRAPFFKVIENIRQQIPYEFVFNSEDVRSLNNITLSLKEVTLQQALDALLEGSGMEYVIEQKTVVIKKKVNSPSEKSKSILLKGFVTDRQKHPLPGVTVKLIDMMLGTSTNHKGYFSIQLPLERGTLEFSFIGYVSQKVNFTERTTDTLRIVMEELIVGMEEVVVTGYQKVDKRRSTSAITSVKASDVLVPGMSSIDQALEGRIPELMLITNSGEVGATPRIRVRGTSTLIGNREPLWVLDGFIMHDPVNVSVEDLNNPDYINIVGNAIAGINPQDIDRIDVLKDASATALYGTKAANGVIVVTTKKVLLDLPVFPITIHRN
ncbi:MAG: carboxypeptidase-like regulatory domain-containing protein [Odoribacter splanchnicus]